MKVLSVIIAFIVFNTATDIASIRQKYISAATSQEVAEDLFRTLESVNDNSKEHTLVAYKAAAITLKAKYARGLFTKKDLFTKGVTLLDGLLARKPDNYEARLLRLNIQENAPGILGYNDNIDEDKLFLIKNYDSQPSDLKRFTLDFVKVSSSFTKKEKAGFN